VTATTEWFSWQVRWPTVRELAIGVIGFAVLAAASALLTGFILVRLPADYFAGPHPPPLFAGRHPAVRVTAKILKNAVGVGLLAGGVVMLFTPGQGVLTILLGLMLLDLPGKRDLERKLVGRPKVSAAINALRARYGREPLVVDSVRRGPPAGAGSPEARGHNTTNYSG
jgi:Putative transmembrane protein (PGPGW)